MDELAKKIQGHVLSPAPDMYSRDYGNIERLTPRAVARPETPEDVQAIVEFARRSGLRVVSRGHGCSGNGQSLSDHIVIDTSRLSSVRLVAEDIVEAGGGTSWGALEERLMDAGLSNKVLTDCMEHSVGGTLSVGGYGMRSTLHGGQVDQVVALDIVTGAGERLRAAPDGPNADLFHYSLCGLGQLGIIIGAELRVERRRAYSILTVKSYPGSASIAEIVRDVTSADPRWEACFVGYAREPNVWEVIVGVDAATLPEHVDPGAMVVDQSFRHRHKLTSAFIRSRAEAQVAGGLLKNERDARYLIGDLNVPSDAAPALYDELRSIFDDARFCPGIFGNVYQRAREASRLPLSPIPAADVVVSASAPCVLPASMVDAYKERYARAIDACHRAGGRIYLYGYFPKEAAFFRRQLGDATFEALRAAKEKYDPSKILGPRLFG